MSLFKYVSKKVNDWLGLQGEKMHYQIFALFIFSIIPVIFISMTIVALTLDWLSYYYFIYASLVFVYVTTLVLLKYKYLDTAKYFYLISSISLTTTFIIIGGNENGVENTLIIFLLLSILLFEKVWSVAFVFLVCMLSYVFVQVYFLNYSNPLFETQQSIYIRVLVYVTCLTSMTGMFFYYLRRIHEYQKTTEELLGDLKEKNQLLEEANAELEHFSYMASHDLKTPLRTINSFIGLIERDLAKGNTKELPNYFSIIKKGTNNLYDLIEDILNVSKLNAVKEIDLEPIDLNEIVNEALKNLNAFILEKNASVEVSPLPYVMGSKNELLITFQNLIENGVKYNLSNAPIVKIFAQQIDREVQVFIKDNGIGIDPKYHSKVFEMFKRLHSDTEFEGTGMGLAICRKIINRLNGEILLDSEVEKGSTFTLVLKRAEQPILSKTEEPEVAEI